MNSLYLRLSLAFFASLVLTIIPMPEFLHHVRPMWVLLLVLYVQLYLPEYFHLILLLLLGLLLDVLLSTVMGEHTLALALVTWTASTKTRRFMFFPIGQQMAFIAFFCFLYQLIVLTVDAFLGFHIEFTSLVASPLVSVLLWPWIRVMADGLKLVRKHGCN